MKLNELRDNPGATKPRKRVGRGPGSGTGKTAGRGMNGQKSRSGTSLAGFEGGQMPLYQRLPKRGFRNFGKKRHAVVNLGVLQGFIDAGKIDAKKPITEKTLLESGLVRRIRDGVRVLGKGELTSSVDLVVSGASRRATEMVEAAKGSLTLVSAETADPDVQASE
ncbi:MAG: 50S ribosomal protein L15 [Rhodobacteraceae bacterium]|nr:50S ribosomal protein L15 [Paracoccaceae bacterium]MCY4138090.1 50S ribosomal protein L15 [Paracoccaceae bacterium]